MRRFLHMYLISTLIGATPPALAEGGPAPWPEFTFKRVGVPTRGQTGPRITVQVDPAAPAPPVPPQAVPEADGPAVPTTGWEWFWTTVRAEADQAGGRRTWPAPWRRWTLARDWRSHACSICRTSPPPMGPKS